MSAKPSVAKGAVLMVAMRWTDQLIGIVSTLILARLLVPEDFGIVAMASLVIGLVDVVFDLGLNVALIQNADAQKSHYDTAWTLRLIESGLAAALLVLCAPWAAQYFQDARVEPVLQVLAIGFLIAAVENMGVVQFQKELRFAQEFQFAFAKRIAAFIVTIALALALKSYWALVLGGFAGRFVGLLLSYRMSDMRPALTLVHVKEILAISKWMVVRSVINYLNANVDKFLLGRTSSAQLIGGYTLSSQIAGMPSTELLAPLNRVLFPALVRAKHDAKELSRLFLLAQSVQATVAIPLSVGLALLAPELVAVLLGERWLFVVPFIQILALANIAQAITASSSYLLMTKGEFAKQTLVTVAQFTFFLLAVWMAGVHSNPGTVAWLRVGAVFFGLVVLQTIVLQHVVEVPLKGMAGAVYRPILASGAAAALVLSIGPTLALGAFWLLLMKSAVGLLGYLACIALLWISAGRPTGGESYLLAKLFPARPLHAL